MNENSPARESHDKAWALFLENSYSQAKEVLVTSIGEFPDYAPTHLLLGQIHFFSKEPNYKAALREFQEVVRISPAWEEGHHWLGSAFEQIGDIENAIASYQEAIRLAPEDSRPRVALGNCFVQKGSYSEAIKMFRRSLESDLDCWEADVRAFLAEAFLKSGQIQEACSEWRRVLEIEPGYPSDDEPHKEARDMLSKYCGKS
jgi:tetratricopeptide (TPR) repeat protein